MEHLTVRKEMILDQLQDFALIYCGFFGTFLDGKRPWCEVKEPQAEIYRIAGNGGGVREEKRNGGRGKRCFRVWAKSPIYSGRVIWALSVHSVSLEIVGCTNGPQRLSQLF
jgi:hypothetical protein